MHKKIPMLPGLGTLLDPLDLQRFRDEYWHRRHYAARAKQGLVKQLSKELEGFDVHRLLQRHSGPVQTWSKTTRGAFAAAEVTASAASAAYDAGVTLYLHQLDVPALTQWQRRLARELGHSQEDVTCSVFAAKQGAGTRCHFDSLENFTVQLQGTKTWHVSPNRHVKSPLENWVTGTEVPGELRRYCESPLPADMPKRRTTLELRPGDILYVPRGYWHSTEGSADSLSLFLGFSVTPCLDRILSALRSRLLRNASWRENFIDAAAGREWEKRAKRQVADLLSSLQTDITELTADDVMAATRSRRR